MSKASQNVCVSDAKGDHCERVCLSIELRLCLSGPFSKLFHMRIQDTNEGHGNDSFFFSVSLQYILLLLLLINVVVVFVVGVQCCC